jgi:hypothetical protein
MSYANPQKQRDLAGSIHRALRRLQDAHRSEYQIYVEAEMRKLGYRRVPRGRSGGWSKI